MSADLGEYPDSDELMAEMVRRGMAVVDEESSGMSEDVRGYLLASFVAAVIFLVTLQGTVQSDAFKELVDAGSVSISLSAAGFAAVLQALKRPHTGPGRTQEAEGNDEDA